MLDFYQYISAHIRHIQLGAMAQTLVRLIILHMDTCQVYTKYFWMKALKSFSFFEDCELFRALTLYLNLYLKR